MQDLAGNILMSDGNMWIQVNPDTLVPWYLLGEFQKFLEEREALECPLRQRKNFMCLRKITYVKIPILLIMLWASGCAKFQSFKWDMPAYIGPLWWRTVYLSSKESIICGCFSYRRSFSVSKTSNDMEVHKTAARTIVAEIKLPI